MNDILVRLMDEAQIIDPASGAIMHVKRENFQKFAELIVRECVTIVERKEYSYHEADPLWETAQLIKDHFGVVE